MFIFTKLINTFNYTITPFTITNIKTITTDSSKLWISGPSSGLPKILNTSLGNSFIPGNASSGGLNFTPITQTNYFNAIDDLSGAPFNTVGITDTITICIRIAVAVRRREGLN